VTALNAVLFIEITAHEVFHAWEHVMKRRKYKKIEKWYDDANADSRSRRRYLENRLFELDSPATIAMRPTVVEPSAAIAAVFSMSSALANELLAAYQAAYQAAEAAGDNTTSEELCEQQEEVEDLIIDLEAFAGQISDLGGIAPYLQTRV
jgi:bacterioferritin (cytochrome b1)